VTDVNEALTPDVNVLLSVNFGSGSGSNTKQKSDELNEVGGLGVRTRPVKFSSGLMREVRSPATSSDERISAKQPS
jgi:hypothetical protein